VRVSDVKWRLVAIRLLYVAIVVVFAISIKQFHHRGTGFTYLINFGDRFYWQQLPAVRAVPHFTFPNDVGYDGQWYAQLAVEPLLRDRAIDRALDTPPYRARRILFSWTAYLAGLGNPRWILQAYAAQNIVAWGLLAVLLLRWFPPTRARNVLPWVGCLFGVGLASSVRFALLEGPGMVVIALAVWAVERNRSWLGTGLLALAGLGRETNLIGCTALIDEAPRTRHTVLILALKLSLAVLPLLLWSLYLRSLYPSFAFAISNNFAIPLAGYLEKWWQTVDELWNVGWRTHARFNLGMLIGLTVQIAYLLVRRDWKNPWWRVGIGYCLLVPLLGDMVWEGYPGSAPRVLIPLAFAFNVMIRDSKYFWPLAIIGNLSVWHGISMYGVPYLTDIL
jgi:hypothetical protein